MILSAFFFAAHDYGRTNISFAFVVGFFTGGIWLALAFGPLMLRTALGTFFVHLFGQRSLENHFKTIAVIAGLLAFVIVAATWAAVFDVATSLPIIGHQVTFMFRDSGADFSPLP
jgi:4-amino-4-deoxy-L-arabinose transferase-like glycosyltransferase